VRGHGKSAWSPAGEYQYRDQVSDLSELVDQLGLARFTLIDTSMGGIIAMAYAGEHPERLLRLIINDIGPDMEEGTQRITQMVGSRPDEFTILDEAMAYRRQAMPVMASRSAEDQRELALGAPPWPALWPVLQRLPCPTSVVWGTESDVLSEAQARRR
jgi:esterase